MTTRRTRSALIALTVGLALTGCTDDGADVRSSSSSGSASGSGSGSSSGGADCPSAAADATKVAVTMAEYSMQAQPTEVKAGRLTFVVTNSGKEVHELVVVKSDSPASLPRMTSTDPAMNTMVDEDKLPAGSFIGEVEGVPAGATCSGSFALTAGSYALFCNIVKVEDGKSENHLDLGMQASLTVA
ncbi:MAG TPA: hypothetical protein VNA14_13700 [Mycobacteriales bacterium]|nr:hypothetical protein [Mycobacteriales bacterium]